MSCSEKSLESFFIPLEEIHLATQNFSADTKIGDGGFGMVYKGQLSDRWQNRTAAIKRLDPNGYQGKHEYFNELEMVASFHHQNIITFIGYCDEGDEMIIVFEYVVNESLDTHIQNPNKRRCLTWQQRLNICLGTARGLEYLHSGLGEHYKVIHRDMKSANILLDENLEAKICDFGLSRSGPINHPDSKFYTKVAGTQFYTDPSYHESGILSKESDVYSFGIVMFELMTGMLAHHQRRIGDEEPKHLMHLVRRYRHDEFNKIIDPHIRLEIDDRFFHTFKEIAYRCINYNPTLRPTMDIIITKIEESLQMADISYDGSRHGQSMQVVPLKIFNISLKAMLLHGHLDIWVKEAKSLRDIKGQVASDPCVKVLISCTVIAQTFSIRNSENPVWMHHFYVPVAHYSAKVQFLVKDSYVVGSQIIGVVGVPVEQLVSGLVVEGTFPVLNLRGTVLGLLTLSIQYVPMEKVAQNLYFDGVRDTYFPLRRGGKVTLYQDAHVDDGFLPSMHLDGGLQYQNGNCWHDIFEAIKQARHLIYITGWSVVHSVQLVCSGDGAKDSTLGDLLKAKSAEGVRVLLLIWNHPTSRSFLGIKRQGIMGTNEKETLCFFKHSSVKVILCPRSAQKGYSWVKKQEVEIMYAHHQKTVIVDADAGNYRRRIMAFVGGLDLCEGCYDTPSHPLYSTLQTLQEDDFFQPNYIGPTSGLPREPWHDLHCRIEGPAAYDVLKNFEERWLRASKPHGNLNMKKSVDDLLLKLESIPDILGIHEAHCTGDEDPEGWHVQVFRSIDSNSVEGFPKDPKEATNKNLVCRNNVFVDMSIHTAYVKAIRAARYFIYIESQKFIGSSYNWSKYRDLGADNLIPMEIALKIANKIRANERFAAYILISMWPEGSPTSTPVQMILFWQNKTMQMMYEVIYKALVEVGLENVYEPQDYLMFFCLGTRESSHGVEPTSPEKGSNAANTSQSLTRKNRRFMIGVHSKGMIVDDEYVISGSANINQRSLEGFRDTEIAMGAYQPYHTWANKHSSPRGQIFGYRMSLWAEHIGGLEGTFERPESIECVRRVRSLSESNWNQYAAVEVSAMKAHLLKYPIEVDRVGQVKPLPGCPTFPDMGGNIVGNFCWG